MNKIARTPPRRTRLFSDSHSRETGQLQAITEDRLSGGIADITRLDSSNSKELPGIRHRPGANRIIVPSLFEPISHHAYTPSSIPRGDMPDMERHTELLNVGSPRRRLEVGGGLHDPFKCPCCRCAYKAHDFFCPSCLSATILRLNRVKKKRHFLLQRRAELAARIEDQLREQLSFTSELHIKQQSIDGHKLAITTKRSEIERLRKQLERIELVNTKSRKNVLLLEKKTSEHLERIRRTTRENNNLRVALIKGREKKDKSIRAFAAFFTEIFPISRIERQELRERGWETRTSLKPRPLYRVCDYVVEDPPRPLFGLVADSGADELRPVNAALLHMSQLTEALACMLHTFLPCKDLTRDFFLSSGTITLGDGGAVNLFFQLHYATVCLALYCGISSEELSILTPLGNLCRLLNNILPDTGVAPLADGRQMPINANALKTPVLSEAKAIMPTSMGMRLRSNIAELHQRLRLNCEDGKDPLMLSCTAEEDWVSVDFAL